MSEKGSVAAGYQFCTRPVAQADVRCDGFAVGASKPISCATVAYGLQQARRGKFTGAFADNLSMSSQQVRHQSAVRYVLALTFRT